MTHIKVGRVLIILVGLLSITCSDDEVATRSYPAIDTKAVTEINQVGANLNAEILNPGSSGISDHGFVYDDVPNPTLDKSDRISLGETGQRGTFSALANRNLVKDKKYYVKAYSISKSNDFIVYGQEVEFISLGGSTPEIEDFIPKHGVIGDTVMLIGTGFSNILSNNIVHFGQNASTVIKVENGKLWCIVPTSTIIGENELSLTLGGNKIKALSKFLLQELIIKAIDQEWVTFRDVLTLNIDNLPNSTSLIDINVLGKKAEIVNLNNSEVKVKISDEVTLLEQAVRIKVGSQTKESEVVIKLKPPTISSFEPLEAKRGEVVTINGDNFHPIKDKQQVKFGSYLVEILTVSKNNITVKLPNGLVDQMVNIEATVSGQKVISDIQFHLLSPWRKISEGPTYSIVSGVSWSACGFGYVTGGLNNTLNTTWRYEPSSDSWMELTPYPTTTSGELFSQTSFSIGCNGYVGAGAPSAGGTSHNMYRFSPDNNEWQPIPYFSPGETRNNSIGLTLNGKGYVTLGAAGLLNETQRGTWEYNPDLNSWRRVADFPGVAPIRSFPSGFSVGDTGYILLGVLDHFWSYNATSDTWTQLPDFPGLSVSSASSFAINGVGYVVGGSALGGGNWPEFSYLNEVWQFDTNQKTWLRLEDFPGVARHSAVAFVIGNKAYYGTGLGQSNGSNISGDFWEFDPTKL